MPFLLSGTAFIDILINLFFSPFVDPGVLKNPSFSIVSEKKDAIVQDCTAVRVTTVA